MGAHLVKRVRGSNQYRFATKYRVVESGCWEWLGAPGNHGYGTFSLNVTTRGGRARNILAHRWSYEHFVGPIPEGMWIDHLCRNRICVNPAHLEVVTPEENKRRGESIAAMNARKTHCKWGHEFTPENTIRLILRRNGRPGRHCKMCHHLHKRGLHPRQQDRSAA